jgi:hypothetical protein
MLTYSQFTLQDLKEQLNVTVESGSFLPHVEKRPLPEWLKAWFDIYRETPLARSEKAVSETIISPVLTAVKAYNLEKIALFSGEPLTSGELTGICDFIIAANPKAYLPEPPLIIIIEAKRQDLNTGIPQCAAEMVAAKKINEAAQSPYDTIFGCVTTGTEWLFLKNNGNKVITHHRIYFLPELETILGTFQWMIDYFYKHDVKA